MNQAGAVFLSYASQDAEAARKICEALRAGGVEVWFDQSSLVGGDVWDAKIRRQIQECALFLPVISASTQARREGYFRLEWKLAAQRTHMISDRTAFLLPVVIDGTRDADADVPAEFRAVQWTRLPAGETSSAFCTRIKALLTVPSGEPERSRVGTQVADTAARTKPRPRRLQLALAATVIALGAIGVTMLWRPTKIAPAAPATSSLKSVAVLAFEDMSPNKDAEYFSDGVSEEILNALANNPNLRVAARTSSFSFKGKKVDVSEIGRALNVARVIEGSVRKSGNKVRITVQLINAADGYHLWSEPFDRDLTDIFAVQAEIAAKVAQKLGGDAAGRPPLAASAAIPTKNLAAHDAYLRGRARHTGAFLVSDWRDSAIVHYGEAVRLDPDYALAWARIAQIQLTTFSGGRDRSDKTAAKVREAAANAARLDPDLPEALFVKAMIRLHLDRDAETADRELAAAERRRPHDAELAAARAELEWVRGNWGPRAAALVLRATDLDPRNTGIMESNGRMLTGMGWFADAELVFQRWSVLEPSHEGMIRRRAVNHLAWTGDRAGALAILNQAPDNARAGQLILRERGEAHAALGEIATAIAAFEELRGRTPQKASGPRGTVLEATTWLARLEERQGQTAKAKALLAAAMTDARQFAIDFPNMAPAHSLLAIVHALRDEKSEARAAAGTAMQIALQAKDAGQLARIRRENSDAFTLLGEFDAAIAELRALHEMGWGFGYTLRHAWQWEPLRSQPKFQQLMKEAEARADAQPRPKK